MDAATGITVLIDNSLAQDGTGTQLFTTPDTILTATCLSEVPDIISAAERAAHNGKWVAGFIEFFIRTEFGNDRAMWTIGRSC